MKKSASIFSSERVKAEFRCPASPGYSGETCHCGKTFNVPAMPGTEWVCPECQETHIQTCITGPLHFSPDYGPMSILIHEEEEQRPMHFIFYQTLFPFTFFAKGSKAWEGVIRSPREVLEKIHALLDLQTQDQDSAPFTYEIAKVSYNDPPFGKSLDYIERGYFDGTLHTNLEDIEAFRVKMECMDQQFRLGPQTVFCSCGGCFDVVECGGGKHLYVCNDCNNYIPVK